MSGNGWGKNFFKVKEKSRKIEVFERRQQKSKYLRFSLYFYCFLTFKIPLYIVRT